MNRLALFLIILISLLTFLGLFILYESSSYTALINLNDKYYFIKNQSIWIVLGIIGAFIVSRLKEGFLYNLSLPLLAGTLILLLLVFMPGIGLELNGSHRWINLGFNIFQPSELLKVSLTLYLASWLSVKEKGRLGAFFILICFASGLVLLQPDFKTAFIIVATSFCVYFVSGAKFQEFLLILLTVVIGVAFLTGAQSYRVKRISAFLNFDVNNLDSTSYHTKQIVIALGSGGIGGVGFGNSVQKYAYLPEHTTDSIFAIFAEEAGFIGSTILISIYIALVAIGIMIAHYARSAFGKLLATGVTVFITIQTLINLMSQSILIPLTGVPLPFISYGGSSMLINFLAIGLLLNVALDHKAGLRNSTVAVKKKRGFSLKFRR